MKNDGFFDELTKEMTDRIMVSGLIFVYKSFCYNIGYKGLTYSSRTVNNLVIQGYLDVNPGIKYLEKLGYPTGKVSNVIMEWKRMVDIPNVEELRDFATAVKKS